MAYSPAKATSAGVAKATELFTSTFGTVPTVASAAPGRVNLIGEHTDYNDGFVFPLALEKNTYIVGCPAADPSVCRVVTAKYPGVTATFTPGDTPAAGDLPPWAKYVKGMSAMYARAGYEVAAFDAAVVSDVPLGGGLSSSAALEMATAVLIEALGGLQVDAAERAKMGQACEHEFAGVPCGIMDQLISSRGEAGRALLIDCRTCEATPVPLDDPDTVIVVANSCVEHALTGSEYPTRRRQCEEVAEAIAEKFPERQVKHLRDADLGMLEVVADALDVDAVKRARHVIMEDERTLEAKACLEEGNMERVGKLMVESHESLRDLYEVSTVEIDALVDMAMEVEGVYGSRITGGGFGGCTVTLVKKESVPALKKKIQDKYPDASEGLTAEVFATKAGAGARVVTEFLAQKD